MRLTSLRKVLLTTIPIALCACGGSSGGDDTASIGGGDDTYGATPSPSPAPTPAPAPTPTPSPEQVVLDALAERNITKMGSTFSVNGEVSILVDGADGFEFENQDKTGFSLYTFDVDPIGESACTSADCVTNWPPLLANDDSATTAPLSIIAREDGEQQLALRGKPLYFFSGDSAAGQVNGEGVGGVWRTAVSEPTHYSNNDNDGVFLAASGEVSVSVEQNSTSFVAETQNKLNFSLYTFDIDESGVSNCNDGCLSNWPALLADENDVAVEPYSIIERQLGSAGETGRQWAYQGMPLYFFAGDSAAGDTAGAAIPNWRLARPQNTQIASGERADYLAISGLAITTDDDSADASFSPLHGFALYTFDNDTIGTSNCTDGCLSNWPALLAPEGAEAVAPFTLVTRASGTQQWALNGKPLYTFANDSEPGDVNGDGAGGVWHLARTAPVATATVTLNGSDILALTAHGDIIDEAGAADNSKQDFTLYTFDDDTASGVSTCFGGCAIIWPPLFAPSDAQDFGDFTVTRRDDPSSAADDNDAVFQWAYKGQPLYFVASDTAPGDTTGEYGTWHVAIP